MSKLLVIIGITGNQGASVADVYLNEPGWKIRGIARNPAKAKTWTDKGVEIVKGDLNDIESLKSAFKDATAIFGTTDFWHPFFDPANQQKLKPGQTINEFCYELEVMQGKNIADAAATVPGLERFVSSVLSNTRRWSNGKYKWVYHFDSKAAAVDYIKEKLPELAKKTSYVQLGMFMTNWQESTSRPTKQQDGTFRLNSQGDGTRLIPHVLPRKDMGYFARALIQSAPGKNLLGAGTLITWPDFLKLWCETQGKTYGGYDDVSIETVDKAMPGGFGKEMAEMYAYASEFGYDGSDPSIVLPKDLDVPCPTTSLEEYFKSTDFSPIL